MSIFANTQFLKLWGNQVLLQVAFNMSNFTALLLIDHLTGSRFALALFYAAMTLPAFLLGIFAGGIVDLTERKKLMLTTDALMAVLFLGFAVFNSSYFTILAIAFAASAVSQFFIPAEAATIPLIVHNHNLSRANALFLFTELGSVLVGYAIAGPFIQYFGGLNHNGAAYAFAFAALLTSIGFFLRLSLRDIKHEKPEVVEARLFHRTVVLAREALIKVKSDPALSVPIFLLTAMEFNIGMLAILFISYVREYLHVPTTSASYFLIMPVISGLVIGLILMGRLNKSRGQIVFIGSLAFATSITILGLTARLIGPMPDVLPLQIITIAVAVIAGIAAVFIQVNAQTSLQESTERSMLGRTFSLAAVASAAVAPVPILLVSIITEKIDVTIVFIFLGITLFTLSLLTRSFMHHLNQKPPSLA